MINMGLDGMIGCFVSAEYELFSDMEEDNRVKVDYFALNEDESCD